MDDVTKYDVGGTPLLSWTPASYGSTGLTTDGTNLWILDGSTALDEYTPLGANPRSVSLNDFGIGWGASYPSELAWDGEAIWMCGGFDIYRVQVNPGTDAPNRVCTVGSLPCGNGSCVPSTAFCDGDDDCGNGLDESACGANGG